MHRMHPILNRIRAHKGIDYAARTGTPVKTTGDGIISFSGPKGAYGQVVIIQHNDRDETLYAHLSAFKKGLKTPGLVMIEVKAHHIKFWKNNKEGEITLH